MGDPTQGFIYLGDGVYACYSGPGVWLHANDHLNPTDRVYLDLRTLDALNKFVQHSQKEILLKHSQKEMKMEQNEEPK